MTQRRWVCVILVLAGAQALLAATVPVAVSPGRTEAVVPVESRCPTFSWGAVEGAKGHELVVYRVGEAGEEGPPVLEQRFAGSVSSWTPSLDGCLERGGRYAWTVRAAGRTGASDWSPPSLFRVAPGPSEAEFEEAVEVVRSYLATRGEDAVSARREGSGSPQEEGRAPSEPPAPLAPPAATQLSVDGNIEATSFTGDGENLANVATDAELATHAGEANVHHTPPTGLPPSGAAGGDLTGTYPDPTLGPNVVGSTEITDGSVATGDLGFDPATQSELDTHAGAADVHHTPPTSLPPGGPAGGDLTGRYPDPQVGDALARDAEVTLAVATHERGASAHHPPPTSLPPSGAAGGDLTGRYPDPQVGDALARDAEVTLAVATHERGASAHHFPTVDTTCNGQACDGVNFTNIQWGSLASRPAGLDDGDDDTTYGAGAGLALTGSTFSLASGPALGPRDNTASTVDAAGDAGQRTSITLGADGLPVVSYWDGGDLKVAKCNDPACSGGDETVSAVDSGGNVGAASSITLGADGLPVVSYYDASNGALKVAKCNDPACSGGNETISTVVVDYDGNPGRGTSITLSRDGLPVVSYIGEGTTLDVAKCNDDACAGGNETLSTVDSDAPFSTRTSITLGADGLPVVSYLKFGVGLKVAKCNDDACAGSNETISIVDGSDASSHSITLGADGLPVVSYRSGNTLKVAKCNDPACAGTGETLSFVGSADGAAVCSGDTSITLGTDGLPIVSYYDNGSLKVAKCNDDACAGGNETLSTVDSDGDVGEDSSITLGADGLPVVSYRDATNGALKMARCGSAFCVPYLRRR